MTLINADANHSSSDKIYYTDNDKHIGSWKTSIQLVEDLFAQFKAGETSTSRDQQLIYAAAMKQILENNFVTINEYEKCATIDEAIYNGLRILFRNKRYEEITGPLSSLYNAEDQNKNLPEIVGAYNKLVASSSIQYRIQEIYNKLLPMVAKSNNRDMQDYIDMGVWHKGSETIKINILISHIKDKLDKVREEQEGLQARFMYLSYIFTEPRKALLGKINALSSNKFEDILIKHDTGSTSSTTLNIELVPADKTQEHCYIHDITANKPQVTYTKGGRSYPKHADDIMAVIMGEAKTHFKLS